ncbi:MAG: S1 RNA-binding domain-containing protein, partial [Candidatus Anaerobiospirillum pullicola]|nr:S1 RNA-binding domain-containing protein [Candidatus Anaerobiospirillum pullicola]
MESFAELFEESNQNKARPGDEIQATVVEITPDFVRLDAGLKSESIVPIEQFKDDNGQVDIQIGDTVSVVLEAIESGDGETLLSREKAKRNEAWAHLDEAFKDGESVTGVIDGKVKGGFTVQLGGIRAFLPGSLVDIRPVRDTSHLEGKELQFKVIKIDQKRNNVVVSRRAVIESEHSADRENILASLQEGQVVKGIVKNLTDYGAFVDLGGVDGLLHITDMAWKRVKHPSEIVSVGDEIQVKVLK